MVSQEKKRNYRVYVLRSWLESGDEMCSTSWRFSLEDPQTSQRLGFANLGELMAFLEAVFCLPSKKGGNSE